MIEASVPWRSAFLALACAAPPGAAAQTGVEVVRDRLRDRVAAESRDLRRFYESRGYHPAWSGSIGLLPRASEVAALIHHAERDGLRAADYALPALRFLLDADTLAEIDLHLSRAALGYAADLANGRVDPARADTMWSRSHQRTDPAAALAAMLDSERIATLPDNLAPPHLGYRRLRAALARYRAIAARGGWPVVSPGPPIGTADSGARVHAVRARLAAEGEFLTEPAGEDGRYDATLEQAIARFQARHGLEVDGQVGPPTLAALNVPVEVRIRQIELNLERWRWLPRELGDRYVMVNTAAAELELVDAGRVVLTTRAIVGRPDRPTPLLSARATSLLFGPTWHIPRAIAVQEILPALRRDGAHLARERIRVFHDSARTIEVDPAAIDWSRTTRSAFAFHLQQEPGGTNPLGGVKLVAPNRFDAYVHDTPARALFRERVRTLSHGCVRAEHAAELATYLLRNEIHWPADSVRAAMAQSRERWVPLPSPAFVHMVYWTAWADELGTVQFRDDAYGWDARLADALGRSPHTAFISTSVPSRDRQGTAIQDGR